MWHALIAVIVQALFGVLTHDGVSGGVVGVAIFVGREHAQAEYRWIEKYGAGKRANMPWWGGFDLRVWTLHSVTDVLLPVIAVAVMYCFLWRWV